MTGTSRPDEPARASGGASPGSPDGAPGRASGDAPGSASGGAAARGPGDLARDPALARLWERVRRRLASNGRQVEGAAVSLPEPSGDERRALQLLLGTRLSGTAPRVRLGDLDAALRASVAGVGLTEFLERAGAPVPDRRAEDATRAAREDATWRSVAEHAACARHPDLAGWIGALRDAGTLRREAESGDVPDLRAALDVLAALPCEASGRAALAGRLLGDAHALDDDRAAGRLVLAALAYLSDADPPVRAADRRDTWARWGVATDATSSRVIALCLPASGDGPVSRAVAAFAEAGVPFHLTLAMLDAPALRIRRICEPRGDSPADRPRPNEAARPPVAGFARVGWTPGPARRVFVCENPAVVEEAALRFRGRCPPMVCVEGMPSVAARRLLGALRASGAELLYHGDFGAGGLRIGNVVIGELGARPWRFGAADYEAALARVPDGVPIRAPVPDAVWDPALAPSLRRHRREIQEEQVLAELLADVEAAVMGSTGDDGRREG